MSFIFKNQQDVWSFKSKIQSLRKKSSDFLNTLTYYTALTSLILLILPTIYYYQTEDPLLLHIFIDYKVLFSFGLYKIFFLACMLSILLANIVKDKKQSSEN